MRTNLSSFIAHCSLYIAHCSLYIVHCTLLIVLCTLLTSCYSYDQQTPDAWNLTEQQIDSISFSTTHHYTQGFNFLVRSNQLPLIVQHPTEVVNGLPVDTLLIGKGDRIVVADIATIPADSVDSIWVKVARDQQTIGWTHEREMLTAVSPDSPISLFIDYFSNAHLLFFLAFLTIVLAVYVVRRLMRLGAPIVHFNDIDSFYPTLLCLLVATSAVFYSSIQLFAPDSWRHYYYHPTLNPFSVPFHLSLFLTSVWLLLIVAIAAFDEVRHRLAPGNAIFFFLGLAGVCAIAYVVFSVSTLYYIGYPLLIAYYVFAINKYFRHSSTPYRCGNCGEKLRHKGTCPHCGAVNE